MSPDFSRRGFLVASLSASGGLLIGLAAPRARAAGPELAQDEVLPAPFAPNLFVAIERDGTTRITCHRSEMGQGVRASLPALIAAELGADLSRIAVVQAPGDAAYGDQNTDGSTSVRLHQDMLRQMGATARALLIAAAAAQWGVAAASLDTVDHAVVHAETGRSLPFGDLVAAAAALPVPDEAPLRSREALRERGIGGGLPFADARAFATGTATYGADPTLPDMRIAVIARPPALGAALESHDAAAALAVPGVESVHVLPTWKTPGRFMPLGGVAVVARSTWAAIQGRKALAPTWSAGPHGGVGSPAEWDGQRAQVDTSGKTFRKVGKADKALAKAAKTVTAVYTVPHLAHATMEPPAALVSVEPERVRVWAPVQAPQRTAAEVARTIGRKAHEVHVEVTFLGGGFGRKSKPDFVSEAAWLSQQIQAPVRVQWTREDDLQHGYYHANAVQRLDAGLDESGRVVAWRHRTAETSIISMFLGPVHGPTAMELGMGALDLPLDLPHVAIEGHTVDEHLRIGWMRSVANINHAFAIQCFVDELAQARGVSTPAQLKELIGPPRLLTKKEAGGKLPNYGVRLDRLPIDVGRWHACIDEVVARSGYGGDAGEGRAFGFAAHASFNTTVAVVVAVARTPAGLPRVDEAWVVAHPGSVLNLDRVKAQMEGAVVFGQSIAVHGEITYTDGIVDQSNYDSYPVVRMGEAPRAVHVHIIDEGLAPGGIGEPGVPPVAPAIANGWAALTGTRVRRLPIAKQRPG